MTFGEIGLNKLDEKSLELLETMKDNLEESPNLVKALALSPYALESFIAFKGALSKGKLDKKLRLLIPLVVAEANQNIYCLSSQTALAKFEGVDEQELTECRMAISADKRIARALEFAWMIVENRGRVKDKDIAALKEVDYGNDEIIEIIAQVALSIFLNYIAEVTQPPLGYPKVEPITDRLA
jgi:AhpD family alkylhydroperoxidase